jgi:DNA-binding MarR family transcriptional regulator
MAKEFRGVWIPKEIYQDRELNPTEKLILSDIATLGEYFKSNETIAIEVGVAQCTVTRSIKKFEKLGYIKTQYDGRTRLIKLRSTLSKLLKQTKQIDEADYANSLHSIQDSKQLSKHISKGVVYPFEEKEFKDTWKIWIEERRANQYKKYSERAEQGALHKLQKISNHDYKTAIAIINESISNGWRGLFALKESKQNSPKLDFEESVKWAYSKH